MPLYVKGLDGGPIKHNGGPIKHNGNTYIGMTAVDTKPMETNLKAGESYKGTAVLSVVTGGPDLLLNLSYLSEDSSVTHQTYIKLK